MGFEYNGSIPKLTEDFKKKYIVNIKGKDAITVEGLVAIAHEKGLWKMDSHIIQFPSQENKWTAICSCTVGGYDVNPIDGSIREVEYTEIGDANEQNCGKMVAPSYIRMASTRAIGRVLRKYTNVDMLCSNEISEAIDSFEAEIDFETLAKIKDAVKANKITKEVFFNMLNKSFNATDVTHLSQKDGEKLLHMILSYVPVQPSESV
jgi:hypothetical protein